MNKKTFFTILGLLLILVAVKSNTASVLDMSTPPEEVEIRGSDIESIIEGLSLEEKVGQMLLLGIPTDTGVDELKTLVKEGKIGSVILMGRNLGTTTEHIAKMIDSLQAAVPHEIPLFISVDQEGGIVSRLKGDAYETTGQPEIETTGHAKIVAQVRAQNLRSLGINVNFAPVLEYITDENSFLYDRVFRGDAGRVGDLGVAMIEEYQKGGIVATVKHFPGHADDSVDSHGALPVVDISNEELPEHIALFRSVITQSDPGMVMMGHVLFPHVDSENPSSISRMFVTDLLRRDIGYKGVIITDDMNMGAITNTFGRTDAAVTAVRAGNDILLYVGTKKNIEDVHRAIVGKVESGIISEARIDESVQRILTLKKSI